ncbi:SAM-dependent methyltransferase [Lottiidibacillus patelloidae]|uniref:SAM-dependent methyltransferase n=1 Tax=Lottiidibacillus patelloidae TaxID=2670334 RepID=A0A263BQK9_9BACI|nr:tRNA1(Val) (adenine(37)-N6)-methyltransferase [Lottiidibacillus patelloidae]OZM55862.1 SAM-dependent methyltransferase [Lottiidibacillus patelloidae]
MVKLLETERFDDLLAEGLKIIQSSSISTFSLDAVLLANFVYVPIQKGNMIDLCTGNGVIPLMLSKRTKGKLFGVEIQERIYDMAKRSVIYNELQEQINLIHGDLKDMPAKLGQGKFEVVTCNPPYFTMKDSHIQKENEHLAIARHELLCTLEDTISASSKLVKNSGKVAFVHRPNRLLDIIGLMKKYNIEPKRIRFVHPREGKEANTILVEGIKNGKSDLKILPPLLVYQANGEYTEEMKGMLYGE